MNSNSLIPQKSENYRERVIDDETVVMSSEGDTLYTFEGSARFIWNLIDGKLPFDKLLARVIDEYEVEPSIALSDLEAFLAELQKIALIKIKEPRQSPGL
jgi:hypothetical protein